MHETLWQVVCFFLFQSTIHIEIMGSDKFSSSWSPGGAASQWGDFYKNQYKSITTGAVYIINGALDSAQSVLSVYRFGRRLSIYYKNNNKVKTDKKVFLGYFLNKKIAETKIFGI